MMTRGECKTRTVNSTGLTSSAIFIYITIVAVCVVGYLMELLIQDTSNILIFTIIYARDRPFDHVLGQEFL